MAAGEYISVRSQADSEQADIEMERKAFQADVNAEHQELAAIYVNRGLTPTLAKEVAQQLMAHDALGAHARDELGITDVLKARPLQAALTSAASFAVGAGMPAADCAYRPTCATSPRRRGSFVNRAGCARWLSRTCGWSRRFCRCNTRTVLGRVGHGTDRQRRVTIWTGGVIR